MVWSVYVSHVTFYCCVFTANGTAGGEFNNVDGGWGRGHGHGRGRGGRSTGGRGGFRGHDREQDPGSYEEISGDMEHGADVMKFIHCLLTYMNMTGLLDCISWFTLVSGFAGRGQGRGRSVGRGRGFRTDGPLPASATTGAVWSAFRCRYQVLYWFFIFKHFTKCMYNEYCELWPIFSIASLLSTCDHFLP